MTKKTFVICIGVLAVAWATALAYFIFCVMVTIPRDKELKAESIFNNGVACYLEGVPANANPMRIEPGAFNPAEIWLSGWRTAKVLDEQGQQSETEGNLENEAQP